MNIMDESNTQSQPPRNVIIERGNVNCTLCGSECSKTELKKHMVLHVRPKYKNMDYKCLDCDIVFKNPRNWSDHIYKLHPGYKLFKCETCGKRVKNATLLKLHNNAHLGTKNFECDICGVKFLTNGKLTRHFTSHNNNQMEEEEACLYCEKRFTDFIVLKMHILSTHAEHLLKTAGTNNDNIRYKCTKCDYIGSALPATIKHFKIHTESNLLTHICKYCNVRVHTSDERLAHEKKHLDSEGNVHFKCHECPSTFESPDEFAEHYNMHYEQLPFGCKYCPRKFTLAGVMARHVERYHLDKMSTNSDDGLSMTERVHIECYSLQSDLVAGPERDPSGNLAFICKYCGNKYFGYHKIWKHYSNHEAAGDKYACPICDMGYPWEYELNNHLMNQHDKKAAKTYECYICKEVINGAINFKKHCNTHNEFNVDTYTYSCLKCNSEHKSYLQLVKHLKTHEETSVKIEHDLSSNTSDNGNAVNNNESSMNEYKIECDELPCSCKYCSKRFEKPGILAHHIWHFHSDVVPESSINGVTKRELLSIECYGFLAQLVPGSIRNDVGELGISCKYCKNTYYGLGSLLVHQKKHTVNQVETQPECDICGKEYKNKTKMAKHKSSHKYDKLDQAQECLYCEEEFWDTTSLKQHILDVHADCIEKAGASITYKCHHCTHTESFLYNMIKHFSLHNSNGTLIYSCQYCTLPFPMRKERSKHEQSHLDENGNVSFDCDKCSETFENAEAYADHYKIHRKPWPQGCPYCPVKFEHAANLARHIEQCHKDSLPPLVADNGLTLFEKLQIDLNGFKLVPGPQRNTSGSLAMLCNVCNYKLHGFAAMFKHLRIHKLGDKYSCPICAQTFSQEYPLRNHLKTQHDKKFHKTYNCHFCNGSIKGAINFYQHVISHEQYDKEERLFKCEKCNIKSSSYLEFKKHFDKNRDCQKTAVKISGALGQRLSNSSSSVSSDGNVIENLENETDPTVNVGVYCDELPHACHYCNSRFALQGHCAKHILQMHLDQVPNSENGLTKQETVYLKCYGITQQLAPGPQRNNSDELAFICKYCGKKKYGCQPLLTHQKLHEDGDRFPCPVCDSKFPRNNRLQAHLKVHDKTQSIYNCTICRIGIEGADNFNNHCLSHSEYNKCETTYNCSKCSWQQNSFVELVKHLEVHKDKTPYLDDASISFDNQSFINSSKTSINSQETSELPLSVTVYQKAAVKPECCFIIWCRRLESDLIDLARLYPDRVLVCVLGSYSPNLRRKTNLLLKGTSITIKNADNIRITMYSAIPYNGTNCFTTDFEKNLRIWSKCSKAESFVRQSFSDIPVIKSMISSKLTICNYQHDSYDKQTEQ